MTGRRDSDTASFLSTNTDPISSPSDGYFSNRAHPQEMFIDTEAANKGAKVRVEAASPRSATRYSQETTPLLSSFVGHGPPPSYLEATTPNPWNARSSGDEAARLLAFDGRISPAPLADPRDSEHKDWAYRRRSFREHWSRKRLLKWGAAILLVIILAAILAAVTHSKKETNTIPVSPVPVQPAPSAQPQKDYPIRWPARCGKDYNVKTENFEFGSQSELRIEEGVQQMNTPLKRVLGWIHVVNAPEDQPKGTIRAKFSYALSSSVDINSIKYASSAYGLTIGDSSMKGVLDGIRRGSACLGMSLVVYVAQGAKLENFNVRSVHLGMQIYEGIDLSVSNATSITLTSGTLDAFLTNSRETYLDSISGSISGKYSLYDLLHVNTLSGSVNINIEPKKAAEEASKPAVFRASSVSGSIRADYERKSIPERDYQIAIDTKVGSIDGTFIHGSSTSLTTVAGSIIADVLPFKSGDDVSSFDTNTQSGETRITIQTPYKNTGSIISKLTSSHKTASGSINLTYPQEWEGHLVGNSLSGALHLQGKDLELLDETTEPGKNHVEAKKGKGKSELTFSTVSGGCEVKIGKL